MRRFVITGAITNTMADKEEDFDFMFVDTDALDHFKSHDNRISNTHITETETIKESWVESQRYAAPDLATTLAHVAFRPSEPLQRFLSSLKHLIRASDSPDTMRLVVQIIRHTTSDSEKLFEAQTMGQHADLLPPSIIPYLTYGQGKNLGEEGGKFGQIRITTPIASHPELGFSFDSVAPCAIVDPIRTSVQNPKLPIGMGPAAEVLASKFVTVFEGLLQKCVVAQTPLSLYFHRTHFEFKAQFKRVGTSNIQNDNNLSESRMDTSESREADSNASSYPIPTSNRQSLSHNVPFVSRTDMNISMQKKMQCTTQDEPIPDPNLYDFKKDQFVPPLSLRCHHDFISDMLTPLTIVPASKNERPVVVLDMDFTYLPDATLASTCDSKPWQHELFLGNHVEITDMPPPSRHIMHVYERSVTDSEVGGKTHLPLYVVSDQSPQALPRHAFDHFVEICSPQKLFVDENPMNNATKFGIATFHYPQSKFVSLLRMLDLSDKDSDFNWWLARDYGGSSNTYTAIGNVSQRMTFQAKFFKACDKNRSKGANSGGIDNNMASLSMSSPCWVSLSLFPSSNAAEALAFADYTTPRGNPVYRAIESGDSTSAFYPTEDIAFSNLNDSFMRI